MQPYIFFNSTSFGHSNVALYIFFSPGSVCTTTFVPSCCFVLIVEFIVISIVIINKSTVIEHRVQGFS